MSDYDRWLEQPYEDQARADAARRCERCDEHPDECNCCETCQNTYDDCTCADFDPDADTEATL